MNGGNGMRAAIGVLVVAGVAAAVLGSPLLVDQLFESPSRNGRALLELLSRPNWTDRSVFAVIRAGDNSGGINRYVFAGVWPLATAALALGLRGATPILAGWAAAIAGGGIAGGIQGLTIDRSSIPFEPVEGAIAFAGTGAAFGLAVGWALGLTMAVLGAGGRSRQAFTTGAVAPPLGGPGPATFGPPRPGGPWPDPVPGAMPPVPRAPRLPRMPRMPKPPRLPGGGGAPTGRLPPFP